jgi:hypothetical protein
MNWGGQQRLTRRRLPVGNLACCGILCEEICRYRKAKSMGENGQIAPNPN